MNRRDADLVAWWNALSPEDRSRLCETLGISGTPSDAAAGEDERRRIELALALMKADRPRRPH